MKTPATETPRPTAAAGRFYPADPVELRALVVSMLSKVPEPSAAMGAGESQSADPLKALIAPHAGYVYSGPIAASGYAVLRERASDIKRVVIIGPAHFVRVSGIAASPAPGFETPLGVVRVDRELTELALRQPGVSLRADAHAPEHSIEVHLPFLQVLLRDFTILPLVVGQASVETLHRLVDALWGGPETFFVVSSDLSHYRDWATACQLDAATAQAVERLDWDAIAEDGACGRLPICGLLASAKARGMTARTLDLRNSGDTAGPRSQVVGYGAFAVC